MRLIKHLEVNKMAKAVIYARVSSKEQEREGYSIPAQLKFLNEYAKQHGFIVTKEFVDNETAKKSGRTNFGEMIKYLRKNTTIKTILVEKTDRLYRNFKDYVILDEFEGIEIHLVKENTILSDNSKSHEKFIHGIKVLMAKNYIDNLSEEVKKGMMQKALQGEYPAKPPYGYKRNKGEKEIFVVPEEALFVQKAFDYYSTGNISMEGIVKRLFDEGIYYKDNQPKIYKGTLGKILQNPFYTGVFLYNDVLYNGKHKAIIDKQIFEKAQLAMKKDNKPDTIIKHDFLYGGLITCKQCGSSVVADIKKGKYVYYFCSDKTKGCSNKKIYIKEERIDKIVEEAIKKISLSEDASNIVMEALRDSYVDQKQFNEEQVNKLTKRNEHLKTRISQVYLDKLDGTITEEFWKEKHNEWSYELAINMEKIKEHTNASIDYMRLGGILLELLKNLYPRYIQQNQAEKKKLLKIIFSNFFVDGGNIDYTYKKPFNSFVEGASCLKWWALGDSNSRPSPCKGDALPTELNALLFG